MTEADKANEGREEKPHSDALMQINRLRELIAIGDDGINIKARLGFIKLAVEEEFDKLRDQLSKEREMIKDKLIRFKRWYDKLSPSDKCTVWPPAGSGSGTGLYDMPDEDLIDKFLKYLAKATELDKK